MRYFLDTEYDGWGGRLISLALVPDDGRDDEFYCVVDGPAIADLWVDRHVMPYLWQVPSAMRGSPLNRQEASAALGAFLSALDSALIIADWPEDLAQFNMLLITGPGRMALVPNLSFDLVQLPGFSTAANSVVPHNALHDARALRDHVLAMEGA